MTTLSTDPPQWIVDAVAQWATEHPVVAGEWSDDLRWRHAFCVESTAQYKSMGCTFLPEQGTPSQYDVFADELVQRRIDEIKLTHVTPLLTSPIAILDHEHNLEFNQEYRKNVERAQLQC